MVWCGRRRAIGWCVHSKPPMCPSKTSPCVRGRTHGGEGGSSPVLLTERVITCPRGSTPPCTTTTPQHNKGNAPQKGPERMGHGMFLVCRIGRVPAENSGVVFRSRLRAQPRGSMRSAMCRIFDHSHMCAAFHHIFGYTLLSPDLSGCTSRDHGLSHSL